MVAFASDSAPLLTAAGIWEEWISPETGEVVRSFALLTDEPMPFVAQTGHDRSPLFLTDEGAQRWLSSDGENPAALKKLLQRYKFVPKLSAHVYRPLKDGLQKRI
ncbi:MAG: SOS response-associated peptidase family protein [Bdellovibrionales bacterium]|nr:SOS response-associated peptidase family protein [Bdellovibrionales bacterium]